MVEAYRPLKLKEALELAAREKCILFAGGTDLMVRKKRWSGLEPGFENPVVFVSDIIELKQTVVSNDFLEIGSACTCASIAENSRVPEYIRKVILEMASPGIRNIATMGGNICNSSPAGDTLPMLYALDAILELEELSGRRELNVTEFITGPGKNLLRHGEILTKVKIPLKQFAHTFYRKVATRRSTALSKLSFVGLSEIREDKLVDIRLAFGAAAPTVVRSRGLEEEIINMSSHNILDVDWIIKEYSKLIKPIDDQRSTALYRKKVSLKLLREFLLNYRG